MAAEILCQDCRSNDIRQFRTCGYHKVRCNSCGSVHSTGIVSTVIKKTELVASIRGVSPETTILNRSANAATKRMEHEMRYSADKTVSIGDPDEY